RRGAEDDEDALADVLFESRRRHATVEIHGDGKAQPFAEEIAVVGHRFAIASGLKAALDELLALATRDSRGVLDLFDGQGTMMAKRARGLARPSGGDHVEHILPSD